MIFNSLWKKRTGELRANSSRRRMATSIKKKINSALGRFRGEQWSSGTGWPTESNLNFTLHQVKALWHIVSSCICLCGGGGNANQNNNSFDRAKVLPPWSLFCSPRLLSSPCIFYLQGHIFFGPARWSFGPSCSLETLLQSQQQRRGRTTPSDTVNSIVDQILGEKKSSWWLSSCEPAGILTAPPSQSLLLPFLTVPYFFNTSSSSSNKANLTEPGQFYFFFFSNLPHFKKSVGADYILQSNLTGGRIKYLMHDLNP